MPAPAWAPSRCPAWDWRWAARPSTRCPVATLPRTCTKWPAACWPSMGWKSPSACPMAKSWPERPPMPGWAFWGASAFWGPAVSCGRIPPVPGGPAWCRAFRWRPSPATTSSCSPPVGAARPLPCARCAVIAPNCRLPASCRWAIFCATRWTRSWRRASGWWSLA